MWNKIKSGGWAILIVALVWVITDARLKVWHTPQGVINNDIISYYGYLPAIFIYHDASLKFKDDPAFQHNDKMWAHRLADGRYVLKMSMGLSFLYLPFFLGAHAYCQLAGLPADGFSNPYEKALVFSSLFYAVLGLIFLRKLLSLFFSGWVTSLCLLTVGLGTNLFNYVTLEACMSHAYLFSLFTAFALLTFEWYRQPNIRNTVFLGLTGSLIALVRPTNVLIFLIFLLYGLGSFRDLQERVKLFLSKKWLLVLMAALFMLVWLPQLLYWKFNTGQWFFFSYIGERFYFFHPHFIDGFFSYRKGWLVYTPLMAISLAGFVFLRKKASEFYPGLLIFFLLSSYFIVSWWCWWYGGGFGMRPFIDMYGLLALPLGSLISVVFEKAWWKRMALVLLLFGGISLQLFQSRQYYIGSIHWDSMTREAYWASFFKKYPPPGWHYLLAPPDYEGAQFTGRERKTNQ